MRVVGGALLCVQEIAARREGVKCWEIHWQVPSIWELKGKQLYKVFKFTGKDGKEMSSELNVSLHVDSDGLELLAVWHNYDPTLSKGSVCVRDKAGVEQYLATGKGFSKNEETLFPLRYGTLFERRASLAPDDKVTFIYRFEVVVDEPGLSFDTDPSRVMNPLRKMWESGERSDAAIVVDDKTFPVHRLILSLRSRTLAAMFDADMKEGNTGKLVINDSTPEVVEAVLSYLYTGSIRGIDEHTPEILHLAEKYFIDDLKEVCCISLTNCLRTENAVEFLKLAKIYSLDSLKERIVVLLKENRDLVLISDQWKKLMSEDPVFSSEILLSICSL